MSPTLVADIMLLPTENLLALLGVWSVGALLVGGLMVMLMIRLRVLGPGEG